MLEELIEKLELDEESLERFGGLGLENFEIPLKGGKLWVKKPYKGKVLVHMVKAFDEDDHAVEFVKAIKDDARRIEGR